MQGTGNEEFQYEEGQDRAGVSDDLIVELLASGDPQQQQAGLVLLDIKKLEGICGLLRRWSNESNWRLSPWDIAIIWETTMTSIGENVLQDKFQKTGKLHAYIRSIARHKAIDLLRKRLPIDHRIDPGSLPDRLDHAAQERSEPIELELYRQRYETLSEKERRVYDHDVQLLYAQDNGKWPAVDELWAAVNADGQEPLSRHSVKSRRRRARGKLRRGGTGKGELK